jgi:DNA-binding NarL/FixJ family response regulator
MAGIMGYEIQKMGEPSNCPICYKSSPTRPTTNSTMRHNLRPFEKFVRCWERSAMSVFEEGVEMAANRSRILIGDDHILIAELCKGLLEPHFDVVGIVGDGAAVVRAARELTPDLIVIDIAMPVLNGLNAGEQVKQSYPAIKLIYLTVDTDPDVAAEAFRRGASAYLLKTCAPSELVLAIREVLGGKTYLSEGLPRDAVNYLRRRGQRMVEENARLTKRQRQVLQLLVEGKQMKEIGTALDIKTRTVAFHKYEIMKKLGLKTDADLVRYALRNRTTFHITKKSTLPDSWTT